MKSYKKIIGKRLLILPLLFHHTMASSSSSPQVGKTDLLENTWGWGSLTLKCRKEPYFVLWLTVGA